MKYKDQLFTLSFTPLSLVERNVYFPTRLLTSRQKFENSSFEKIMYRYAWIIVFHSVCLPRYDSFFCKLHVTFYVDCALQFFHFLTVLMSIIANLDDAITRPTDNRRAVQTNFKHADAYVLIREYSPNSDATGEFLITNKLTW